jgi:hypothetical protein
MFEAVGDHESWYEKRHAWNVKVLTRVLLAIFLIATMTRWMSVAFFIDCV